MRGLIAGVLGGAARGYTQMAEGELKKQQELDLRKQLMEAETEKQLRIDEIKRNRDIEDIPRKAEATAAAAPILARGEAQGQIAKTSTPGYLGSVAQETSAKESSATKASAAASNFELSQKRALGDLRTRLSKTTDETERANLQQAINDLSGGTSTKSYSDMVTAAGHYRMLAQNLRKDAEMAGSEEERTDILQRAMNYEKEADAILQATKGKRLGGSSQGGSSTTTGSPREGQEDVSKSGKPIVFRNGQWVYK